MNKTMILSAVALVLGSGAGHVFAKDKLGRDVKYKNTEYSCPLEISANDVKILSDGGEYTPDHDVVTFKKNFTSEDKLVSKRRGHVLAVWRTAHFIPNTATLIGDQFFCNYAIPSMLSGEIRFGITATLPDNTYRAK